MVRGATAEERRAQNEALTYEKEQAEPEEKPKQIEIKDVYSAYLYHSNFISNDPIEQCESAKKAIALGLRLLPTNFSNEDDKKEVEELHKDALELLDKNVETREIEYTYSDQGGVRYPLYAVFEQKSGTKFQAEKEKLEFVERSFINQQYRTHLVELQKIENKIGIALVKYDIIPKMTSEQIIKKLIIKKFEQRYQKEIAKSIKSKEEVKKDG